MKHIGIKRYQENIEPERIKSEKQEKKRQSKAVKEMVLSLIPDEVKGTVNINVREIQCGDPNCSLSIQLSQWFGNRVVEECLHSQRK